MPDTIVIFSSKTLKDMRQEGGCGWWPVGKDPNKLNSNGVKYVVCVFNKIGDAQHHRPLFVATLTGEVDIKQAPSGHGKFRQFFYLDKIAEFGRGRVPGVPVKRDFYYSSLSALKIQRNMLRFRSFRTNSGASKSSRSPAKDVSRPPLGRNAFDPGPMVSFSRDGHSVDPKHAPIVGALLLALERLGWRIDKFSDVVRPDLVVVKDGKKILFEVKTEKSPASFHCAIGQLLVYRQALRADKFVIVAPDKPVKARLHFERVMSMNDISFIRMRETRDSYTFSKLAGVLE